MANTPSSYGTPVITPEQQRVNANFLRAEATRAGVVADQITRLLPGASSGNPAEYDELRGLIRVRERAAHQPATARATVPSPPKSTAAPADPKYSDPKYITALNTVLERRKARRGAQILADEGIAAYRRARGLPPSPAAPSQGVEQSGAVEREVQDLLATDAGQAGSSLSDEATAAAASVATYRSLKGIQR